MRPRKLKVCGLGRGQSASGCGGADAAQQPRPIEDGAGVAGICGVGRGRGRGSNGDGGDARPGFSGTQHATASTSGAEAARQLEKVRQNALTTKRALAKLPASARAEFSARTMKKEVERQLLPGAPSRKRPRKESPVRNACRLTVGTPTTPPPPKLQPWQMRDQALFVTLEGPLRQSNTESSSDPTLSVNWATGGSRDEDDLAFFVRPKAASPSAASPTAVCPSTSQLVSDEVDATDVLNGPVPAAQNVQHPMSAPREVASSAISTSSERLTDERSGEWWERLEQLFDVEEGEFEVEEYEVEDVQEEEVQEEEVQEEFDYASAAPVHLSTDMNSDMTTFLTEQDQGADRLVTKLLGHDNLTFDWSHDHTTFQGRPETFVGPSGPTFPLDAADSALKVFFKYFDDEILDLIVTATNKKAAVLRMKTFSPRSIYIKLQDTNRSEVAIFLAILILQGLLPVPVEKDYFRENGYLTLKYFKDLMPYSRFLVMKKLLQFSDDSADMTDATQDDLKLRKLGPLLKLLNCRFSGLYLPSRDIAIDESLLKWLGRLSFAQKIATKAAKVGVKSYELCESSTGYCWRFFIYTGKESHNARDLEHDSTDTTVDRTDDGQGDSDTIAELPVPTNVTAQIVLDLVRPLLYRGHRLIMDNFYNSPLLARYLKLCGTDCFGTLRVNREFVPDSIKTTSKSMLRQGELLQSYCRDLSITLWRDNTVVALISTIHSGEVGSKEKWGVTKYKPQVVLDYNLAMGGVDKKDQLLSAHLIERVRNQVWYKKVFRRLLNISILNSYIVYRTQHPNITQRQFRINVANELIATFKTRKVVRPMPTLVKDVTIMYRGQQRSILTGNHFIGPSHSHRLMCVWCRRSRTANICKQCKVPLCLRICFEEYHTKQLP